MSRFVLLTLALAASYASSELVADRQLSGYDDDYSYGGMMSGKGGKGGMSGMMSGKGKGYDYDDDEPAPTPVFPAPTNPPLVPCVCVEICDEPEGDDYSGKGGMMGGKGGKGDRQLMMGKGGKGYDDDYSPSPVCYEECSGDCYPEPPALECCAYESVCEPEPEEGKGKGGMMSGGKGGKGDRQLMMGKGGKGYDEDDYSPVCEDVCVEYCPQQEPIYTLTPGDGDMCFDTAAYTTGDDCVCNCECCMDAVEYPEDDDSGKGKGGMMSGKGGMMGGKGKGKGGRQLMMGKGGMMSGKGHYEEPDASFSCACGCACPESVPVPEPSPSPSGKGMMGMMSGGKGGKGGKGSL
jgi:hypothetical protein